MKKRINVLMMQKNEGDILRAWIEYHGTIFGYANITIIDNYSTDQYTISLLALAAKRGAEILKEEHFEAKGRVITQIIADRQGDYDLFLPLDCDEFLCLDNGGCPVGNRDRILAALSGADGEGHILRISSQYFNVPETASGYRLPCKKTIIGNGCLVPLDIGFHLYSWDTNSNTVDDQLFIDCDLSLIHLHNKPFPLLLMAAKRKLASRVKGFTREALENYSGAGRHLTRYLLMSSVDYMESFAEGTVDLRAVFLEVGVEMPFCSPLAE